MRRTAVVVQPELVVAGSDGQEGLAVVPSGDVVAMFERLSTDPNASVEKIERLMALWERMEAKKSEAAFNAAMSKAQKAMRPIAADAYNPSTKSRYASFEALDRVLRPIYTEHGFGLSYDTGEGAPELHVRVLCYVTHDHGHSRTYRVDMPADGKGAKGGDVMTKTHATGSAMSYGQRYLLKLIFNVAVGDGDDDGNAAGDTRERQVVEKPSGYEDWITDIAACADEGWPKLAQAWGKSSEEYRNYTLSHNKAEWERLKAKAQGEK